MLVEVWTKCQHGWNTDP